MRNSVGLPEELYIECLNHRNSRFRVIDIFIADALNLLDTIDRLDISLEIFNQSIEEKNILTRDIITLTTCLDRITCKMMSYKKQFKNE